MVTLVVEVAVVVVASWWWRWWSCGNGAGVALLIVILAVRHRRLRRRLHHDLRVGRRHCRRRWCACLGVPALERLLASQRGSWQWSRMRYMQPTVPRASCTRRTTTSRAGALGVFPQPPVTRTARSGLPLSLSVAFRSVSWQHWRRSATFANFAPKKMEP